MSGRGSSPGSGDTGSGGGPGITYGLSPNARTFGLILLQVALVGATVGVERTVLPVLAKHEFGVASATASLAFIASFGLAKAPLNFVAGRLADRHGRRRVLVAGWLLAMPVPVVIAAAPAWEWVVVANALLGAQQGLCWSTSLFMHVDVAGPRRRGLAIGINELFGYGGTALIAYAAGALAAGIGPRPLPFVLQEVLILAGLAVALWVLPDTQRYVEANGDRGVRAGIRSRGHFVAVCQAGLVTKVTDVVAWGLLPAYLLGRGVGVGTVAVLVAAYPAVWSVLQPLSGALSDAVGRRLPVAAGMAGQAVGLLLVAAADGTAGWFAAIVVLGSGTALVYPVLLAAAGDAALPARRASAIGLYRLVRDLGFVAGALLAGGLSDAIGTSAALEVLAALAAASGVLAMAGMRAVVAGQPVIFEGAAQPDVPLATLQVPAPARPAVPSPSRRQAG